MAKVANDTAAPPEKKSKGKRKNTSGKSGSEGNPQLVASTSSSGTTTILSEVFTNVF